MQTVHQLDQDTWAGPFAAETCREAVAALERGGVLYLPQLAFVLEKRERSLFSSNLSDSKAKNITLDPASGTLQGGDLDDAADALLRGMLQRFSDAATQLAAGLLPDYAGRIERARTTYRPVEIAGRSYSPKKDDKLLHVDTFPSRPARGRRILRLFANINPAGQSRLWHVGEEFEAYAKRFLPGLRAQYPFEAAALALLGITKGRRSAYDTLMLGLHDTGKLDAAYQKDAPFAAVAFPPGSTWLCYTDQVLHAALEGQFALEQTFHLDVAAMAEPARSPLKVLERMTGRALV